VREINATRSLARSVAACSSRGAPVGAVCGEAKRDDVVPLTYFDGFLVRLSKQGGPQHTVQLQG
jgi:hypothetical protein